MRVTYRDKDSKQYWSDRWSKVKVDDECKAGDKYPLKYALELIGEGRGRILEAGCGTGRVLKYFHSRGYDIEGFDYVESALEGLRKEDPEYKLSCQDVTSLDYQDGKFDYVLAFGLYHNLPSDMLKAFKETRRVMKSGGRLCFSFRADSLANVANDYLAERKIKKSARFYEPKFHKLNLSRPEILDLVEKAGFRIQKIQPVVNMPILYKFKPFRRRDQKKFDEREARSVGYRLNPVGSVLDHMLKKYFADQYCNLFVVYCEA